MANEREINNMNDLIFQQELETLFQELEQLEIKSKKNNYMFISTNIISITISIYKKITNKKYIYSR